MDLLLDRAMAQNLIAGGVVVVGNHKGILATSARGRLNDSAGAPAIDEHTIFDIASLTKVIATAPSVMKLLDEGRINLSDPVAKYLPEFAEAGRQDITIFNLLTHTSGLEDLSVHSGIGSVVRRAAAEKNRPGPGGRFHYADINFILLGELVHRVSGQTLDVFAKEQVFEPLGAKDTMFLPPRSLAGSIAPTSGYQGGTVQDGNARRLGGVAGHAGVFSSAYDLSLFARMMLGSGTLEEKCLLSQQTYDRMTTPYYCNSGLVKRGLGWDMESPYSIKGTNFSASSFGHTGYSGSSIWIDPQQDLFVIMLTRRTNYRNAHLFNQLRRDVSTTAAAELNGTDDGGAPVQVSDASVLTPQVLEAAYPAVQVSVRKAKVTVAQRQKQARQHHARRRSGKGERVVAKAGSGRRGAHIRVAKAETGKSLHKKKRTLVKS